MIFSREGYDDTGENTAEIKIEKEETNQGRANAQISFTKDKRKKRKQCTKLLTLLELGKGGSLQSSRERPNQHTKVQARNISTRSQIHICLLRSQEDKKKEKRKGDVDDDDGINWLDGEDCGLGRARS